MQYKLLLPLLALTLLVVAVSAQDFREFEDEFNDFKDNFREDFDRFEDGFDDRDFEDDHFDDRRDFDDRRFDDRFDDSFGNDRFDERRSERDNFEDRFDRFNEHDDFEDDHRDGPSEEDERKFNDFKDALEDLGHNTAGLRDMIDGDDLSKEALYDRFGEDDVLEAVKAAGVENEFYSTPDFRDDVDKFRYDRGDRYGPPQDEHMYGLLFQHLDDQINPRELVSQCSDPDAIADHFMDILRREVGNFASVCDEFDSNVDECEARVKRDCSQIGRPHLDQLDDPDRIRQLEMRAWSCPPDEDAMLEACVLRSVEYSEARLEFVDEICEDRWEYDQERIQRDCADRRQDQNCDRETFIDNCIGGKSRSDYDREQGEREQYEEYPEYHEEDYEEPYNECKNGCDDECPGADATACVNGNTCECYYNEEQFDEPRYEEPYEEFDGEHFEEEFEENEFIEEEFNEEHDQQFEESGSESQPAENVDEPVEEPPEEDHEEVVDEPEPESSEGDLITGNVVYGNSYDDDYERCERDFEQNFEPYCQQNDDYCSKEGNIRQCIQNEKDWAKQAGGAETKINCRIDQRRQLQEAQNNCRRLDRDKDRCFEEASKHCDGMGNAAAECRDSLQESKVRAFLLEEIKQRCEFASEFEIGRRDADTFEVVIALNKFASEEDLEEIANFLGESEKLLTLDNTVVIKGKVDKDRVELLKTLPGIQKYKVDNLPEETGSASVVAKRVANTLANLDSEDIPDNLAYLFESEAVDIAEVSQAFAELEEAEDSKGAGYKFRRFLGMVKEAEEREIARLEENKEELSQSIESLKTAAAQVDDPVAKAVLLEQVEVLREQQTNINQLIIDKQKKALGFFGALFG